MTTLLNSPNAIFAPVFALALLVGFVTVLVLRERVRQFKAKRLHPQKVATRGEFAAAITDSRCADNFANLFETPVLFYVACVGLYVTQTVSPLSIALAWLFVACRLGHTYEQCGSNIVLRRFKWFGASMTALLALWIVWGWALLT